MRLKLSWDFFCTLSHWELGTSKLLTRVQNDRAARCFWYGEIPILVIQSILLKWISDYWIMLPSIFVGLNLMMKQNHFSIFFIMKLSSNLYYFLFICDIMVVFDYLKGEGHPCIPFNPYYPLTSFVWGSLSEPAWSNLFACSMFDYLHVLFPPIINYNA